MKENNASLVWTHPNELMAAFQLGTLTQDPHRRRGTYIVLIQEQLEAMSRPETAYLI